MRPEAIRAVLVTGAMLWLLAACSPSGGERATSDGAKSSESAARNGATEARRDAADLTAAEPGTGSQGGTNPDAPSGAAEPARGAMLFENNCVACHQQSARGIPGVYPSLAGSPVVLGDPRAFAGWVVEGRRAPSMTPGRYTTSMPKFGWMKAADAAALLTYLRSNFGNAAPPVDAAAVAGALED
jgi:mono/diheme cytochrome c family protein